MRQLVILFTIVIFSQRLLSDTTISLEDATKRALKYSGSLESTELSVKAFMQEHSYAQSFSNPVLSFQADNWLGSGDFQNFKSAELTYGLSQTFELGGKRAKRAKLAKLNLDIALLEKEDARLDVIKNVSSAFAQAIYFQELLKSAGEQKKLAENLYKEVELRVSRAREPLIQKNKAAIALFAANFDYEKTLRDLNEAKLALSNLWSEHSQDFSLEHQEFFQIEKPLREIQMEEMLPNNPHLKVALANAELASAQFDLEKSMTIIDFTVNFGLKHHLDKNNFGFIGGLSFPLPFFNSKGSYEKRRFEMTKAEVDAKNSRLLLTTSLHEWLKNIENAYSLAESLRLSIIPLATESFNLSLSGYSAGKTPYYEVLDSQRTLTQVKEQYLSALKDYHVANAEIERLIAKHSDNPKVREDGQHEK